MYFRRKTSAGRAYLQIVESRRDGDQLHQVRRHFARLVYRTPREVFFNANNGD
jgi:hypothetical protein